MASLAKTIILTSVLLWSFTGFGQGQEIHPREDSLLIPGAKSPFPEIILEVRELPEYQWFLWFGQYVQSRPYKFSIQAKAMFCVCGHFNEPEPSWLLRYLRLERQMMAGVNTDLPGLTAFLQSSRSGCR